MIMNKCGHLELFKMLYINSDDSVLLPPTNQIFLYMAANSKVKTLIIN